MESTKKRIRATCTSDSQLGKTLTMLYFDGNEIFSNDGTGESSILPVKTEKGKINYIIQGKASDKTLEFLHMNGISAEMV